MTFIGTYDISYMDPRIADLNSVWWGMPLTELMENAGERVASHCLGFDNVAIFCGRGNNGGDGLVAARHLLQMGFKVMVFALVGGRSRLNQTNLEKLDSNNVTFIKDCEGLDLSGFDLIVDGLVGTGIEGELRQPLSGIIDAINDIESHKLSIDCPSGGIFEADAVISLDSAKVPGAIVEDIGVPVEAKLFAGPGDVVYGIPKRTPQSRKGDFGRLLVIGGSKDYIGAPSLAAMAAMRTGVDLVTVCVPRYVADRMQYDPNLMVKALEGEERITVEDVKEALKLRCDAIVFGNGLGKESEEAVKFLLKNAKVPVVLDAEGISTCKMDWLSDRVIVTPHSKEYERLFGQVAQEPEDVEEMSKKTNAVILLKGSHDFISNGTETRRNKTGNPYMSSAGTGDVLAGVVGGILAQNTKNLMGAACAGAFLTGLAGDIVAGPYGPSLIATDLIAALPDAMEFCMNLGEDK